MHMTLKTEQLLQEGGAPEYVYHDRTAWRCEVFVGKRYGSKGYPQRNAAHVWRTLPVTLSNPLKQQLSGNAFLMMTWLKEQCACGSHSSYKNFTPQVARDF
jgi:hypothetical protein